MSIKVIAPANHNAQYSKKRNGNANSVDRRNPAFTGLYSKVTNGFVNAPVAVADAIAKGGFMFAFIAQDFFGMAFPRVVEGVNRRTVDPETGKKEGPYNWAFARREAIREVLSGPSAFLIPAGLLVGIKKFLGKANNVPVELIQGYGANFKHYAEQNSSTLNDVVKTKREFYQKVFKNVLNTTMEGALPEEKLESLSKEFMTRAIEIEQASDKKKPFLKKILNKKVEGSQEDLIEALQARFMELKKSNLSASVDELGAKFTVNPEAISKNAVSAMQDDVTGVGFKKLLTSLTDFTDDVIESTGRAIKNSKDAFNPEEFMKEFISKRTGTRVLSILGMFSAVIGFYMLIPKLYSLGLGGKNPAFATCKDEEKNTKDVSTVSDKKSAETKDAANPTFGGKIPNLVDASEKLTKSPKFKSVLNKFEFDGASMSVPAMMTLLFGFCFPTRLAKAPDKYDRKETIARDLPSFTAILFVANAIARGFSDLFSKYSGLTLNIKPEGYNKNLYSLFKNYFTPMGGVKVLTNPELDSKYTNIHKYRDGINGFFEFVSEGGNLKKFLTLDANVAEQSRIVIGKNISEASEEEIKVAFKNASTKEAKDAIKVIEDVFKNSKNKYVRRAKLYNSMFTFLSTIVLVPIFMVWLARTCDKMTRNARARDLALKAKANETNPPAASQHPKTVAPESVKSEFSREFLNISMQNFANN